jgi:hypothetical protein
MKPHEAEPANRSRVLPLEHVEHKVNVAKLKAAAERRRRTRRWFRWPWSK